MGIPILTLLKMVQNLGLSGFMIDVAPVLNHASSINDLITYQNFIGTSCYENAYNHTNTKCV